MNIYCNVTSSASHSHKHTHTDTHTSTHYNKPSQVSAVLSVSSLGHQGKKHPRKVSLLQSHQELCGFDGEGDGEMNESDNRGHEKKHNRLKSVSSIASISTMATMSSAGHGHGAGHGHAGHSNHNNASFALGVSYNSERLCMILNFCRLCCPTSTSYRI